MADDRVSPRMQALFAGAVVLMAIHKVECWITEEWLESPLFLVIEAAVPSLSPDPAAAAGETVFLTFVLWLFLGLAMVLLALRGGWGPIVVLGIWGLTFLLECHHLVRSALAGAYYTGTWSAIVYVPFGVPYWRELTAEIRRRRGSTPKPLGT